MDLTEEDEEPGAGGSSDEAERGSGMVGDSLETPPTGQ